ncbi:MAG: flagellar biosynthesis protein FlhB [Bacteroidetes bacterium]|nr:flagellar biosynthesis protein FlhB [Bacteroidota bacterium]
MADEAPDKEERTEPATGKKREDSREKGMVAKSMDLNAIAMLLPGFFVVYLFGSSVYSHINDLFKTIVMVIPTIELTGETVQYYFGKLMIFFAATLLPILAGFFVIGMISNIAQVGFKFTPQALRLKWNKLNPFAGIKRIMISTHTLVEMLKSIFKATVVGIVAYFIISDLLDRAVMLVDSDASQIGNFLISSTMEIFVKVGIAFVVIGIIDYGYQRFEFEKNLRMTKQEVKEETKMTEGNPEIKGRIKMLQRQIAYRRMMTDVPKADVVVTNPTHFAIALQYDAKKMHAPKVLAKGADLMAQKIKEVAKQHNIPTVEDKPLAQALYKTVDIGEYIPEKLFQAVAQILAYIYRLKTRKNKLV